MRYLSDYLGRIDPVNEFFLNDRPGSDTAPGRLLGMVNSQVGNRPLELRLNQYS